MSPFLYHNTGYAAQVQRFPVTVINTGHPHPQVTCPFLSVYACAWLCKNTLNFVGEESNHVYDEISCVLHGNLLQDNILVNFLLIYVSVSNMSLSVMK
jgi:hypothetical protein